jgi:phosphoribosylanthranilate isomerase
MVQPMVRVKVCGVTSVADALICVSAGVDAIGLNFWSRSVRRCDERVAREIVEAVGGRALMVGVFVDASAAEVTRIRDGVGLGCVQLHGEEPPAFLAQFLPHAYKALRVQDASVLDQVRSYGGEYVLLDAYVKGAPGGTGATFDWALAQQVAQERKLTLAGGITPANVAEAVRRVRPFCVDCASGVESAPGVKDPELVRALVTRAKGLA